MRAACGAATLALLPGACAEDPPRPPASVDAGQECELGTRNCACIGGVRCDDDLVCIAGRCSLSLDEPPSVEPGSRPRRPPAGPELPEPDAGAPTVDASAPAPDAPDASGGDGGPDAGD